MTYRDMYDDVITSGEYVGRTAKLRRLAQLIYAEDRTQKKEDCVGQALEKYEDMTGNYFDPTKEEFEDIVFSII